MYLLARNLAGLWALSLLLLSPVGDVSAAIHACTTADGSTIFQDRPCPRRVPVESNAMVSARAPLGIHDSWFVKPEQSQGRAFCDKRGCECEKHERSHNGSLTRAVADALYMDASWHRYEVSEALWQETPVNSSRRYDRRADLIEASCSVMMSQQLLKQFADPTLTELRNKAQEAEERGYDIPDVCDSGDMTACDYYDAAELFKRLSRDAHALQRSRSNLSSADKF